MPFCCIDMIIHIYDWAVSLIPNIHKNIIYNRIYWVSQVSNSNQSWMFRVKYRTINTDTSWGCSPICLCSLSTTLWFSFLWICAVAFWSSVKYQLLLRLCLSHHCYTLFRKIFSFYLFWTFKSLYTTQDGSACEFMIASLDHLHFYFHVSTNTDLFLTGV